MFMTYKELIKLIRNGGMISKILGGGALTNKSLESCYSCHSTRCKIRKNQLMPLIATANVTLTEY